MVAAAQLAGMTFGRLTVLRREGSRKGGVLWRCRCTCGNVAFVNTASLNSGNTRSCGCIRTERIVACRRKIKHGKADSSEYVAWLNMRKRCYDTNAINYHNYGGRGISVCQAWRESFEAFYRDMGDKPEPGHSLDRIDPDGNYEPSNCRWASRAVQNANTRPNVHSPKPLTVGGVTKTTKEWANDLGMSLPAFRRRLLVWGPEAAVSTPKLPRGVRRA